MGFELISEVLCADIVGCLSSLLRNSNYSSMKYDVLGAEKASSHFHSMNRIWFKLITGI